MTHPIHIARCQMEQNPASNRLEITMHVYLDDLEESMRNAGAPKLNLGTAKEIESVDSYLNDFINTHLIIKQGDEALRLEWVGKELSDDLFAYWCYFESSPLRSAEQLDVQFDLLFDLYADQQNIVAFVNNQNNSTYGLCTVGKAHCQFELHD